MLDRDDVRSWLQGPGAVRPREPGGYAGARLGLPQSGPGSVARFGRRLVAVCIDWALCQLVAVGLLGVPWPWDGPQGFVPAAVFAVENLLLVGTLGYTIGHRIMGIRVVSLDPRAFFPLQAWVRTMLLCLAIPALVWDRDGRGLHDKVARTVIVRG
ncbi:MAG TPA: RDD family protein [Candidatus Lustribacter sp.]|nr:RDD family protein [Candidatus Lustribacter sp.]